MKEQKDTSFIQLEEHMVIMMAIMTIDRPQLTERLLIFNSLHKYYLISKGPLGRFSFSSSRFIQQFSFSPSIMENALDGLLSVTGRTYFTQVFSYSLSPQFHGIAKITRTTFQLEFGSHTALKSHSLCPLTEIEGNTRWW